MKEYFTKRFNGNKKVSTALIVLAVLFILGLTLEIGKEIGEHRGNFTKNWGMGYSNNFKFSDGDENSHYGMGNMMGGSRNGNFKSSYGAMGKVLTVSSSTLTVLDNNDNVEKSVLINSETIMRNGRNNASTTAITPDSFVMVIGEPNKNGQIVAKFIRLMSNSTSTPWGMFNMMNR